MPMSLFRLPWVASTERLAEVLNSLALNMAANISLTVVLPLLPVIATNGNLNCERQCLANSPKPKRVSFTKMAGLAFMFSSLTNTADAPCLMASAANVLPSKCSPFIATNNWFLLILRLSEPTLSHRTSAPSIWPVTALAISESIIMPLPPHKSSTHLWLVQYR